MMSGKGVLAGIGIQHQGTGSRFPSPRGFTLTELLVVVAVLAVLVTLLVPTLSNLLARVNETLCASQLRAIGQAATLTRHDAGVWGQISSANWQVTLYPKVDKAAKVFLCPDGPVPAAASNEGATTPPTPGGDSIETNYIIVDRFGWSGGVWRTWGDEFPPGGVTLDDDSPWIMHFSQRQRDTERSLNGLLFGDPSAFWLHEDKNTRGYGWWGPNMDHVYESDGSGVSYWGALTAVRFSGGNYTKVFVKSEPATGGIKLWTHWEARGGGNWCALISQVSENVQTSKGTVRLVPDAAFSMSWLHDGVDDNTGAIIYRVPRPGETVGDLTAGPGPLLTNDLCFQCKSCCPHYPTRCNGINDWIILGAGESSNPSTPGSGGSSGYNCTNYGMNSLAGAMGRPEQIFALDYADTIAKPEEDNWTAPTWDADSDGRLDFARHAVRGAKERANVLFVGGEVRSMTPAEIDPLYQELRDRCWKP